MTKYDGENKRETNRRRMPLWPFLILVGVGIASAGTTYAIVNKPEPEQEPITVPIDSLRLQAIMEQLSFLITRDVQRVPDTTIVITERIIRDTLPVPYPVPSEPEIIFVVDSFPVIDSIPYTVYSEPTIITIPTSTYKPSRGNLAWSIGGFILGSLTQRVLDNCSQSNGKKDKEYDKDRGGKKDGR